MVNAELDAINCRLDDVSLAKHCSFASKFTKPSPHKMSFVIWYHNSIEFSSTQTQYNDYTLHRCTMVDILF